MKFATYFEPPESPCKVCEGKTLTRQECKEECDINFIVARAGAGLIAPLVCPEPVYADITNVPTDYESAFLMIQDARQRFEGMPARLRERFGNDPAQLLKFLGDEHNRDEAIELGLIKPPVKPSGEQLDDGNNK